VEGTVLAGRTRPNAAAHRCWLLRVVTTLLTYATLVAVGILLILPFFWMVTTSVKRSGLELAWPPQWIPNPLVLGTYVDVFRLQPFLLWTQNTLIIAVTATVGSLLTSSMVAFGFARLRFPGRDLLFGVLLSTLMLPSAVTLIPSFLILKSLHWIDTFLPLIVPSWLGGGAFNIFLIRQFFMTIPYELDEAARIDGASSWRIWLQVLLPLCQPVLATIAVFAFIANWNDFMGPLIYLRSLDKRTIALGPMSFQPNNTAIRWNLLMAASATATYPIVVLFFACQRYFMQGIVMTGMSGRLKRSPSRAHVREPVSVSLYEEENGVKWTTRLT